MQNSKVGSIKAKVEEYLNILKMARKPDREEFVTTTKIAITVMFLIGFVGFVIYLLMNVLPKLIKY